MINPKSNTTNRHTLRPGGNLQENLPSGNLSATPEISVDWENYLQICFKYVTENCFMKQSSLIKLLHVK